MALPPLNAIHTMHADMQQGSVACGSLFIKLPHHESSAALSLKDEMVLLYECKYACVNICIYIIMYVIKRYIYIYIMMYVIYIYII